MVHRYVAGLFIFFIAAVVWAAWRHRESLFWARPVALGLGCLYALQVMVGAFNVWYTFPDWLSVAHTVIASCLWATLSTAIVLTFYVAAPERRAELSPGARATA